MNRTSEIRQLTSVSTHAPGSSPLGALHTSPALKVRRIASLAFLTSLAMAPLSVAAQGNYSTPVGGGTLYWQMSSQTAGSCPVGSPSNPPTTYYAYVYSNFSYTIGGVNTSLSGTTTYLSSPGGQYCPSGGWTGPNPLDLDGPSYVISFSGNGSNGTGNASITSISLTSSANPSTYGSSVTFTASITNASGGTVTFNDGSTGLSTINVSGGSASYPTAALKAGTHSITAVYNSPGLPSITSPAVSQTVNKATPSISWPTPTAITYGTALSATQLNASAGSVAGTFAYSQAIGYVPHAGNLALSATFTPTDTADYNSATASVTLTVNQASLQAYLSWGNLAAIAYGTALSATQLNASSNGFSGSFSYSPASGSVPPAGSDTLTATFTPTDSTDYSTATITTVLTVNKATPSITWPAPAAISYGTALSATQLDATSSVPGTFAYSPASGTVLAPGSQTLSTTFTPTDTSDYNNQTASVTLTVNQDVPTITWSNPAAITYGTALSATQLNATASVAGTFSYSPAAGAILPAGTQTLTVTFTPTNTTDYSTQSKSVSIVVNPATETLYWTTPAAINYGTVLSSTQLDANTGGIAGTYVYSPAAGTLLTAGSHTLSVTFTPTDTTDYKTVTGSVSQVVNMVTPTLAVTYSPTSPTHDHSVTFTCTATFGGVAVVNGTLVKISADGTTEATVGTSGGTAQWSSSTLSIGSHSIGCSAGDSNYNSASTTIAVNITPTYDSGTLTLTVNGVVSATATYGQASTVDSVAAGLVNGVTGSSPVTLSESDGVLFMQAKTTGSSTDYAYTLATSYDSADFTEPSFTGSPASGDLEGGGNANTANGVVYQYTIPSYVAGQTPSGYDAVGNIVGYTDLQQGPSGVTADVWKFGYDTLNRLISGTPTAGTFAGQNRCWQYDPFGNRTVNYNAACTTGMPTQAYAGNQSTAGTLSYDAAGNVLADSTAGNTYKYDADGNLCAVSTTPYPGITVMTGYVYDADGTRVAKGTITSMSCDPTTNGFVAANETDYVLGLGDEQVSEIGPDGKGNRKWVHSNIWVAGKLLGTYDGDGLHFYADDWLGTRRGQTDYAGNFEQRCVNMPFGDAASCTDAMNAPTEHFFTSKERDQESQNDYFGARYYGSSIGRFLSPDWSAKQEPVPYARLDNPQSLNLYAYLRNNPLGGVDADGHCITGEPCSEPQDVRADGQQQTTPAPTQQQMGQDPTLPTEIQPPPPSLADRVGLALMPKSPLDLALLVGTDGLGELGGAALRVLELAGEAGKTADYATIAVTETKEGVSIVSSSEARGLRPAVQAALKPGEVAVKGVGHAETTGISAAKQMGLTPTGVAASRGICQGCWDVIKAAGAAALTAFKKGVIP